MPYSRQYEYLIFMHDTFDFSQSFNFDNSAFIAIFIILIFYTILILYAIFRLRRSSNEEVEPDENMKKIIQEYRREINEGSQPNATSFISLSTEPHNKQEYILKNTIQETEMKTLPAGEEHQNHTKDDLSMISSFVPSNDISMILQKTKSEIKTADLLDNKILETDSKEKQQSMERQEKEGLVPKKEEKQMVAPPTFTDRFDVINCTLSKKEGKNETSPGLAKSINVDLSRNTTEDLNVKRGSVGNNSRSPKLEQNQRSSAVVRKKKRVRHNVNTKFKQLIRVSNPIYSTYLKESRFFPKHIRITLIYFEVIFCLFLTTLTVIKHENTIQKDFGNLILYSYLIGGLAWGVFLIFTMILTTDKDKLVNARNDEDFYSALINFERENKYRTLFGYIMIHGLVSLFYIQILAFCTVIDRGTVLIWILVNVIVLISQHFLIDFVYYFLFSSIYVQAYDSKTFKQIYNLMRGFRVWIV